MQRQPATAPFPSPPPLQDKVGRDDPIGRVDFTRDDLFAAMRQNHGRRQAAGPRKHEGVVKRRGLRGTGRSRRPAPSSCRGPMVPPGEDDARHQRHGRGLCRGAPGHCTLGRRPAHCDGGQGARFAAQGVIVLEGRKGERQRRCTDGWESRREQGMAEGLRRASANSSATTFFPFNPPSSPLKRICPSRNPHRAATPLSSSNWATRSAPPRG